MAGTGRAAGPHREGGARTGARCASRVAPARRVALGLLTEQRRHAARMCDLLWASPSRGTEAFLASAAGRGFERKPLPRLGTVVDEDAASTEGSLCLAQRRGGPDAHYLSLLVRTA